MIIFYQIIRKTKSKKGVNGYDLIALFSGLGADCPDDEKRVGIADEYLGEYPLPEIVIPPAIQAFLDRQEQQQLSENRIPFSTR